MTELTVVTVDPGHVISLDVLLHDNHSDGHRIID